MAKDVTLTIDGKQVSVPAGTLIVDAAKKIGIDIPVFCYHPKMEPVGMCRMCLVDIARPVFDRGSGEPVLEEDGSQKIQFGWKLETACTVAVSEGMVVEGMTEKVKEARKDILEFILTSHPLDCPVCDKGGECPLQNLTMEHGSSDSRFIYDEKIHFDKNVPLGDLIFLDRERCIQCARCIRFQAEIVDDPVIGFYNRGRSTDIVTYSDPGFDSYWSGNTSDICPVGALTTADFRFGARPWELKFAPSLSPHSPVGANLTLNIRREAKSGGDMVIKRVMPRQNEWVNETWISDKDRFAYHFYESNERLLHPMMVDGDEQKQSNWMDTLNLVGEKFKGAGEGLLTIVSGRLANEDLFNIQQLTKEIGGKTVLYSHMAGGDLVSQVGVGKATNLSDMGAGTAILVVASDLEEEAPIWWLRVKQASERGATLIVANPRSTKLDRYADLKLRYVYGEETVTVNALIEGKDEAAKAFAEAENAIVLYGSEGINLEASSSLSQACANLLVKTGHVGKANNGLIGVWEHPNTQGAWELGIQPVSDLAAAFKAAKAVYIAGADPAGDLPAYAEALADVPFMVIQELFPTKTTGLADVVLPAQSLFERQGSYTSGERRVQVFNVAVPRAGRSRADFHIAAAIGKRLDIDLKGDYPSVVMLEMAKQVPAFEGVNYQALSQVEEQWPIIGRSDLYYGGTSYDNKYGLGVQLANQAEGGTVEAVPVPAQPTMVEGKLIGVPINRLYDRGQLITKSDVLEPRLPDPFIVLNPGDAEKLGGSQGTPALVEINGTAVEVTVSLDVSVPAGFVLVPRSMGIPVDGPAAVEVKVAEKVKA